ncbi:unnamed protein product [Mytilus coruscus]|uniref:Ig-like domain-containing protein n=1 Tax=Mytilus coruscus TaxID=42192 RepID=A0A6J8DT65_MYTCO|nr:unnamed protein product [Mytilus coruscus]
MYIDNSLKAATRSKRGKGIRRRVQGQNKIPQNWQSFLRDDNNRKELFSFLSQHLAQQNFEEKNGVVLSNSSSIVVENVTQDDKGNYTCHMKNEQGYITKNELLIVSPSRCMVDLNESHGFLEMNSALGFGTLIVLLIAAVICNLSKNVYCKKLSRIAVVADENLPASDHIEMTETEYGYHTIHDENFGFVDTDIEITSSIHEAINVSEVQMSESVSDGNDVTIEEDNYLHPYCTMMQNQTEIHEYRALIEHDIKNLRLNTNPNPFHE